MQSLRCVPEDGTPEELKDCILQVGECVPVDNVVYRFKFDRIDGFDTPSGPRHWTVVGSVTGRWSASRLAASGALRHCTAVNFTGTGSTIHSVDVREWMRRAQRGEIQRVYAHWAEMGWREPGS